VERAAAIVEAPDDESDQRSIFQQIPRVAKLGADFRANKRQFQSAGVAYRLYALWNLRGPSMGNEPTFIRRARNEQLQRRPHWRRLSYNTFKVPTRPGLHVKTNAAASRREAPLRQDRAEALRRYEL
jgi:hypothetical protein